MNLDDVYHWEDHRVGKMHKRALRRRAAKEVMCRAPSSPTVPPMSPPPASALPCALTCVAPLGSEEYAEVNDIASTAAFQSSGNNDGMARSRGDGERGPGPGVVSALPLDEFLETGLTQMQPEALEEAGQDESPWTLPGGDSDAKGRTSIVAASCVVCSVFVGCAMSSVHHVAEGSQGAKSQLDTSCSSQLLDASGTGITETSHAQERCVTVR